MDKKYNKILIGLGIITCILLILITSAGILGYMAYKPFVASQFYDKGVRYKEKGWVKDSKEMMNKAIEQAPNSIVAKNAKHYLKTKLPKSDNISYEAIQLNIKGYNLQKEAAKISTNSPKDIENKYKEAIETYKKSITMSPEFEWPYSNIGRIYLNEGQNLNIAERYFKKALEINPNYFNASLNLGLTYFKKAQKEIKNKNYNKAKLLLNKTINQLNKANKLDSSDFRIKENLSDAEDYLKLVKKKQKSSG